MAIVSMKQLLEAGVHFGHQTRRWNPKMAPYIFTERNGIYIIDLQKTVKKVEECYNFLRELAAQGGKVLFVGTKKQAQSAIKEESTRAGMFYVNERWLFALLPKKEVIVLRHEMAKLEKYLGGIKEMKKLPDAIFVIDPRKEHNTILEARKLHIPVVATVDTNCDPDEVDYLMPANDDAIRAVRLLTSKMADAILEGKASAVDEEAAEAKAEDAAE